MQHEAGPIVILPVRSMHDHRPHQAQRIDGHVPLAAGDLFARVVASFFAPFGRANRLAVDDGHAGRRLLAALLANSSAQGFVNCLPDARLDANARRSCRPSSTSESRAATLAIGSRFDSRTGSHSESTVDKSAVDHASLASATALESLAIVRPSNRWDIVRSSLRLRLP